MISLGSIRPLSDRILVRRLPLAPSRIAYPESAEPQSLRGVVVAVGPGKRTEDGLLPVDVRPGQVVYFGPLNDFETEDYVMIREPDIRLVESGKGNSVSAQGKFYAGSVSESVT